MRTLIIGNAGSGKSTLARAIAAADGVPVLDLDSIFWSRDGIAVPRAVDAVHADLARFCAEHGHWVIEDCYGDLAAFALSYRPRLILLRPATDVCLRNCRERPWEPAKYKSKAEQDRNLDTLRARVAAYDERDGSMSLTTHSALFDAYEGPKELHTEFPCLPSTDVGPDARERTKGRT